MGSGRVESDGGGGGGAGLSESLCRRVFFVLVFFHETTQTLVFLASHRKVPRLRFVWTISGWVFFRSLKLLGSLRVENPKSRSTVRSQHII